MLACEMWKQTLGKGVLMVQFCGALKWEWRNKETKLYFSGTRKLLLFICSMEMLLKNLATQFALHLEFKHDSC